MFRSMSMNWILDYLNRKESRSSTLWMKNICQQMIKSYSVVLDLIKNYHLLCVVLLVVWMRNCSVTSTVPPTDFVLDSMHRCCWHYCSAAMWTMCLAVCSNCVVFATRIRDPWDRLAFSISPRRRCVAAYFVDLERPWNCPTCSMLRDSDQMPDDDCHESKTEH